MNSDKQSVSIVGFNPCIDEILRNTPINTEVHQVKYTAKTGISRCLNDIVTSTKATYILFLESFIATGAGYLPPLIHALQSDGTAGAVSAGIKYSDETVYQAGVGIIDFFCFPDPIAVVPLFYRRQVDHPGFVTPRNCRVLGPGCVLFRKSHLLEIDGFAPGLSPGYEIPDACIRLGMKNRKCLYQPGSIVTHTGDPVVHVHPFLKKNEPALSRRHLWLPDIRAFIDASQGSYTVEACGKEADNKISEGLPPISWTIWQIGKRILQLGDFTLARQWFEKFFAYRETHLEEGDYFDIEELERLFFEEKKENVLWYRMASLFESMGEYSAAEKWFDRLAEKCVDTGLLKGVYFHRGQIAYHRDQYRLARVYFGKCLELEPNHQRAGDYLDKLEMKP